MTPRHLGARGQITLDHCGQPMTWKKDSTHWEGAYPEGVQHDSQVYCCDICETVTIVTQVESDRPRQQGTNGPRHLTSSQLPSRAD
jgi:hypothetical protein